MLHATDVWVAQVGVPVRLSIWKHPELRPEVETEGLQGAARVIPLSEIRPYTVDVGPDGELSTSGRYWTTEEDIERLYTDSIPEAAREWKKRRVMLYLHSGFQDEDRLARRIIAFRDVMLKNEVYPRQHHVGVGRRWTPGRSCSKKRSSASATRARRPNGFGACAAARSTCATTPSS